jgi:hypothetical protein
VVSYCEDASVRILITVITLELKKIISQNVCHSGSMCRDERWEELETYAPGSTVLVITVFNL